MRGLREKGRVPANLVRHRSAALLRMLLNVKGRGGAAVALTFLKQNILFRFKTGRLFYLREKQPKALALLRPGGATHGRVVRGLADRAATWGALTHRVVAYRFIVVRHVHAR